MSLARLATSSGSKITHVFNLRLNICKSYKKMLINLQRLFLPPPSPVLANIHSTLIQHWVYCILCASTSANTCHSHNAVSMLTHSHRRWPNNETALGDCPVFSHTTCSDARKATSQITRYISPMLM